MTDSHSTISKHLQNPKVKSEKVWVFFIFGFKVLTQVASPPSTPLPSHGKSG